MKNKIVIIILSLIILILTFISINLYFKKYSNLETNDKVSSTLYLYKPSGTNKLLKTYEDNQEIKNILNKSKLISEGIIEFVEGPDYILYLNTNEYVYLRLEEDTTILSYDEDYRYYSLNEEDTAKLKEYLNVDDFITNCTLTNTYNVLNIEESNDESRVYLTLKEYQTEEVATVIVDKKLADFKEGNNYEFTFELNYKINLNTISENFNYTNLKSATYSSKTGMEISSTDNCNF